MNSNQKINTKNIFLIFFFILFYLLSYNLVSAATYYISNSGNDTTNNGLSESTPWKTIAKINSSTFVSGDNILFKRGDTWRESLTVPSSGSEGLPITFGDYGSGEKPIIDGADVITGMTEYSTNIWQKTGVTIQPNLMYLNETVGYPKTSIVTLTSEGNWYWDSGTNILYVYTIGGNPSGNVELGQRGILFNVSSRDHIDIENLTFQHSNTTATQSGAVYMSGGSYLTVTGCKIEDNNLSGLRIQNSRHIMVDNNTFLRNGQTNNLGHNFAFYASTISGDVDVTFSNNISSYAGWNGFVIYTPSIIDGVEVVRISNITIHGNTFNNNKGAGVYTIRSDYVEIYNNTFDGNGDLTSGNEDYAWGSEGNSHVDFYDNTITNQLNNDAVQVYADDKENAKFIRIFRNYINGVINGDGIGINMTDDMTNEDIEIFSNVIINADFAGIRVGRSGAGSSDTVYIYNNTLSGNKITDITISPSFPTTIINNIFSSNSSTNIYAPNLTSGLTSSNNIYYRSGGGDLLNYNGKKYTSAIITTFESTAQTGNPLFINPTNADFTVQPGSPAINTGVDVGLTEDILGNPIVGFPDIGAYEFQPIPTPDTTKPVISSFTIPTTSSTLQILITIFTADDNIEVTGYLLTETSTPPSPSSGPWTTTKPTSHTFTSEGIKTLYAWAKDETGNVSNSINQQVVVSLPFITPPPSGGGGGGGGSSTPTCSSTETLINNTCKPNSSLTLIEKAKVKDVKVDGSINILDFNIVMVNWNKTYPTSSSLSKGDLTGDGIINIFDMNQIMVYWGIKY